MKPSSREQVREALESSREALAVYQNCTLYGPADRARDLGAKAAGACMAALALLSEEEGGPAPGALAEWRREELLESLQDMQNTLAVAVEHVESVEECVAANRDGARANALRSVLQKICAADNMKAWALRELANEAIEVDDAGLGIEDDGVDEDEESVEEAAPHPSGDEPGHSWPHKVGAPSVTVNLSWAEDPKPEPCPECGGRGGRYEGQSDWVPCPACTGSEPQGEGGRGRTAAVREAVLSGDRDGVRSSVEAHAIAAAERWLTDALDSTPCEGDRDLNWHARVMVAFSRSRRAPAQQGEAPDYARPEAVQDAREWIDALNEVKAERDSWRGRWKESRDERFRIEAERDAARVCRDLWNWSCARWASRPPEVPPMAEELRPCPWPECGWAKGEEPVIRGGQANADYYGHAVKCPCCGMRGPVRLTRPEAREAWNSLPRPAAPPEGEGGA